MRRRNRRLFAGTAGGAVGVVTILLGATAFACTTFVGKVTVTGNGGAGTSVSIGHNKFDSTDGMYYCGSGGAGTRVTTGGAVAAYSGPQVTITVTPAGAGTTCTGSGFATSTNAFPGSSNYDVNFVNRRGSPLTAPFSCSGSSCTFNPVGDCMSPRLSNVSNVGTMTISSSGYSLNTSGAVGSRTYSLPFATYGDSTTVNSAVCVSDTSATYANEIPVRML